MIIVRLLMASYQRMIVVLGTFLMLGLCTSVHAQELVYPEARQVDQVDTYHGIDVTDPYRWMEDLESEELHTWMEAQDALFTDYLADMPLVKRLKARLDAIGNYATKGMPTRKGKHVFFTERAAGKTYGQLFVQQEGREEARMLIDLEVLNSGEQSASVSGYSPQGKYLTITTSPGQSRWRSVYVVRVADGERTPETLTGFYSGRSNIAWTNDEEGFFYARYEVPDDPQAPLGKAKVYYHRVGTEQAKDRLIYERPEEPDVSYALRVSYDGRYLLSHASLDGGSFTGMSPRLFYKDLEDRYGEVQELFEGIDADFAYEGNQGPKFWVRTNHEAPQTRLIAVDIDKPEQWEEVIPEAEESMLRVSVVGERLVVQYIKDARMLARVYDFEGQQQYEIDHLSPSMSGFVDDPDRQDTYYRASQLYNPGTTYHLDIQTGESRLHSQSELIHNADDFITKQVFFKSEDGTTVPMFLVHRKDLELDGTNPVFMYGYGAWAWSAFPWQWYMIPWMEMGGVYAVPGIRGGGEYGEAWHQAGIREKKQKGIEDYIAAAGWLIENKYTSPGRMIGNGGSASGILPAAAMVQRPGLFGATLINYPTMDQVRYVHFGSAKSWMPEYGNPDKPDEFKALLTYSPYHNLEEGTCYPPTLIQVGEKDDTTTPMHGYKMVAAMQATQGCDQPILLKIAWGAGHGQGLTPDQSRETQAQELAFLVKALGLEVPTSFSAASAK